MPKRTDIKTILIIGAGPIVIGQACEFDYSGTQACQALKEEGYRIVLVNSNPATIMTDPSIADSTYIEPINWEVVRDIIIKEKPDALLPTMGGQTALNCTLDLVREGVLDKYNVELIGANQEAIDKAEDREQFRQAMERIGLEVPRSAIAHSLEEALQVQAQMGFPAIIRPSFTMGGSGGGIAYNREEFIDICAQGLELSPTRELLIDESLIGWKEYEMEVVRDHQDNCIIVCSIENIDAMGVHTGDSITVAPALTLTDKEYQVMRDASLAVLREIGVDTGGSNVQFGLNPKDGRMVVIEMNPRVSRSSALASKATGFPIAKIAAKLAVGYTLDELKNDITNGRTPASFEPAIDYTVIKIPRFNFEKFPETKDKLTTKMHSVGEVMAMGRTFQEALQKAMRGLESGYNGFNRLPDFDDEDFLERLNGELREPSSKRLWYIGEAFRLGRSLHEVNELTGIDSWFLDQIKELIEAEQRLSAHGFSALNEKTLLKLKRQGFADARLADLVGVSESSIRSRRKQLGIKPVYKRVDTCSGEFKTDTAYLYSTYETECESRPSNREKIIVLGGGPNRIGQGIEFDYCCVHASLAVKERGFEAIMINCNPETVSTDYDVSDRLYFEPLTLEDVLEIVELEQPKGVIVHYGGQTPLKLAQGLDALGVPIIGTSPDAIDRAEDRERFSQLINRLNLNQPANATVKNMDEALNKAHELGYPLVVRPSYVLGGRAMEIVYNDQELKRYMIREVDSTNDSPILLDCFLESAIEVDVDCVSDGEQVEIAGIMQHIEQAGVHSGDSACCLPPMSLSNDLQEELKRQMKAMAIELGVVGLMNAQFAIQGNEIFVLEVNPRASRTVPFVSKITNVPLAKVGADCMMGFKLSEQSNIDFSIDQLYAVKVSIFPFHRFHGVDPILGPEMKSTGEVMGIGKSFAEAYAKAQLAGGLSFDSKGRLFISIRDNDKKEAVSLARDFKSLGFDIVATRGTAQYLQEHGVSCSMINKVAEGRPHVVDMIKNDEIDYIVNTTEGKQAIADSVAIRQNAMRHKINYTTTLAGGKAAYSMFHYGQKINIQKLQEI